MSEKKNQKKNQFTKENQPDPALRAPRGTSNRTKLINALKKQNFTENQFYEYCIQVAMGTLVIDGKKGNQRPDVMMLRDLMKKIFPDQKATAPIYDFPFPENGTILDQSRAVLKAIGSGLLPIDIGKLLMDAINTCAIIEEKHELAERVKALEKKLDEITRK